MFTAALSGTWRPFAGVLAGAALLFACTLEAPPKKPLNATEAPDSLTDYNGTDPDGPLSADTVNPNSGAFGVGERPSSSSSSSSGTITHVDAGHVEPVDAGP